MKNHYFIVQTILLFGTLLLFTACNRRHTDNTQNKSDYTTTHNSAYTLTILAPAMYHALIDVATSVMVADWKERDKHLNIELETYRWMEKQTRLTRLRVEMMAGQAPDIIFLDNDPWVVPYSIRSFFTAGMLADFYTLIDNDPILNRADFFGNILEPWEYDGRLYALPLTFGFEYVGINSNLPLSIIDRFATLETITMHEILQIYL